MTANAGHNTFFQRQAQESQVITNYGKQKKSGTKETRQWEIRKPGDSAPKEVGTGARRSQVLGTTVSWDVWTNEARLWDQTRQEAHRM